MPDYTPHQKKIISRYYEHKAQILLSRLQEIVTELYLADNEAKKKQLWSRAAKAMHGLKIPPAIQAHILSQRRPELLAKNLVQWLRSPPAG